MSDFESIMAQTFAAHELDQFAYSELPSGHFPAHDTTNAATNDRIALFAEAHRNGTADDLFKTMEAEGFSTRYLAYMSAAALALPAKPEISIDETLDHMRLVPEENPYLSDPRYHRMIDFALEQMQKLPRIELLTTSDLYSLAPTELFDGIEPDQHKIMLSRAFQRACELHDESGGVS